MADFFKLLGYMLLAIIVIVVAFFGGIIFTVLGIVAKVILLGIICIAILVAGLKEFFESRG